MEFEVKDSGKRQEFNTGALRDTQEGKGRYDLIPPIVEERLAKHYESGAKKYGDNNFRLGMPVTRYIDSARRHLNKYRCGLYDEDHLIAAIWNIAAIIETEKLVELGFLPKELLDGSFYSKDVYDRQMNELKNRNKNIMDSLNNKNEK